jgi:hypothetical protein
VNDWQTRSCIEALGFVGAPDSVNASQLGAFYRQFVQEQLILNVTTVAITMAQLVLPGLLLLSL